MTDNGELLRPALIANKGTDFASQVSRGSLLAMGSRTEEGRRIIEEVDGPRPPSAQERLAAVLALHQSYEPYRMCSTCSERIEHTLTWVDWPCATYLAAGGEV